MNKFLLNKIENALPIFLSELAVERAKKRPSEQAE